MLRRLRRAIRGHEFIQLVKIVGEDEARRIVLKQRRRTFVFVGGLKLNPLVIGAR